MTTAATIRTEPVDTWGGRLTLSFQIKGSGPPLLYLHPAGGLIWDGLLDSLARRFTVYAPVFPGTDPSDTMAIHQLDDINDVVLAYQGALQALGVEGAPVIGQSFGGMLAAELAATFPELFSRLILLAPAGLWNESAPWSLDFMTAPAEALPRLLFKDPSCEGARVMFRPAASPEQALDEAVRSIWTLGCAAKFLWPVPDRGLSRRLHRLSAPTLIIWGADDALIPVSYAQEYLRLVPHARVEIIPDCGHMLQAEQPSITADLIDNFLCNNDATWTGKPSPTRADTGVHARR